VSKLAIRLSWWGIASLLLFFASFAFFQYSFHLRDTGRTPLFSTLANYELCVVMQLAAALCGFIAMKRGSWWWAFIVLAATIMAIGCFFSEL